MYTLLRLLLELLTLPVLLALVSTTRCMRGGPSLRGVTVLACRASYVSAAEPPPPGAFANGVNPPLPAF